MFSGFSTLFILKEKLWETDKTINLFTTHIISFQNLSNQKADNFFSLNKTNAKLLSLLLLNVYFLMWWHFQSPTVYLISSCRQVDKSEYIMADVNKNISMFTTTIIKKILVEEHGQKILSNVSETFNQI